MLDEADEPLGGGFNDDPLRLVGAVCAYVKETGDFTILDHPTPFDNVPGTEVPLLEHVGRSVNFTINNRDPHGLPLIGRAGQFSVLVNQLLAHSYAQRAIKASDPDAIVGIASTGRLCYPETETPENIDAARAATFAVADDDWTFTHHWLLDPVCLGKFPEGPGTELQRPGLSGRESP